MNLSDNIKRLRKQKQLTQPKLAEISDISKGYIYLLEAGEMENPSLDILHKIANALECTIADLLDEPKVVSTRSQTNIPDGLLTFAKKKQKAGEPLDEDDLINLANIKFRGRQPETEEDWSYFYEIFKRNLDK